MKRRGFPAEGPLLPPPLSSQPQPSSPAALSGQRPAAWLSTTSAVAGGSSFSWLRGGDPEDCGHIQMVAGLELGRGVSLEWHYES